MKVKSFFWWLEAPNKIIWTPFWWLILLIVVFSVPVLRVWWWLIAPIILMVPLKTFYLWWIGWDFWYSNRKWSIIEIIPPKEILAPLSAMEDVFNVVWSIHDKANWREIWCEGELPFGPEWCSWEIASIEGKVHFYIRCISAHRHIIESVIYSHYPEIEIIQTSDYTKNVPQNMPNEEWNLYGEDYLLAKDNALPIKTYTKFFEPQGERISAEEKRIDPIVSMLEDMSLLGPGEQAWFQMVTTPIIDADLPWREEAKETITKSSRRPVKIKRSWVQQLQEIISTVVFGVFAPPAEGEEKYMPPAKTEGGEKEMILTPGERETLTAIEDKIKKPAWKTTIRGLYIAKRSCYKGTSAKVIRAYFPHFGSSNLNFFRFSGNTRTKVHFAMRETRKRYRQRRIFQFYVLRFPPSYPSLLGDGNSILTSEELATIYHFPIKITGTSISSMARVESKKGGPPANLPVEE